MKNNTSLKDQMESILIETLRALGKQSRIIDVSRYAYDNYKDDLRPYQWQYDLRWSASNSDKVISVKISNYSLWSLKGWEDNSEI